jgi:adenylate cyclase
VVEKLLASGRQPDLGGEVLTVTVLFSDIRNFTSISESLNPHEVVEMLNTYFSRVCEPILAQGGTVDKFIGDAVMAVFGSPAPHGDHARRALRAALAMVEKAREFQTWMERRFPNRGLSDFRIGIGVHTGEAVVGNIGSPQRFEFTAIGDTVNTASRLEGLSKELGWTIVASSRTIETAGPGVVAGGSKELKIKGRREAVVVAEVQSLEENEPIGEISAWRKER